ncbi:peptidylprolyl isomerase [candidate division KSB1 bacterium]
MYFFRVALFVTAIIIFASPVFAQQESPELTISNYIDGIAAVVNEEIILHSEVILLLQQAVQIEQIDLRNLTEAQFKQLYTETLQKKINAKAEVAKALEDSLVTVTEDEIELAVQERIDNLVAQFGSETNIEERFGSTMRRVREILTSEVRDELIVGRLRQTKMMEVTVSRSEIERFYETYKDSLPEAVERFDISHILKMPKPSGEEVARKRALADSLRQLILGGEDFAELAEQFSEDGGSNRNGGEYGLTTYGSFVQEFEDAVREINVGEISQPVRTEYGFHIIEVLEKQPSSYQPRHILIMLQPTEEDEERLVDSLNVIRQMELDGQDFNDLSAQYSDPEPIKEERGVIGSVTVQGLTQIDQDQVFANVVRELKEGEVSKPFQTGFGYHIVKLHHYYPAHELTIETDYETIQNIALQQKQSSAYLNWLEQIKEDMFIDVKQSAFIDTTVAIK